jgi:hypothetical protein
VTLAAIRQCKNIVLAPIRAARLRASWCGDGAGYRSFGCVRMSQKPNSHRPICEAAGFPPPRRRRDASQGLTINMLMYFAFSMKSAPDSGES